MGVALSNIKGYRMKKALFMVGEGNTGKSQLKGLTERLLGSQNYSNIELSQLEERFGSYSLFNKRLAGSSDMGYVSVKELKIFKQITGGDNIFMEDKGKSGFSGRFNGVLWFGMNELPKFGGDRGEWVYNRIIPFVCSNVIPENEQDKEITDKMYAERETIIFKATSLDKPVKDTDDITLKDTVLDDFDLEERVTENVGAEQINEIIWREVEKLPERECAVIIDRFKNGSTQQSIAEKLNISNSRVHQIEASALRKLRCSDELKKLADVYGYDSYKIYSSSLSRFKNTGLSSVEEVAINRADIIARSKMPTNANICMI